jgi:hypothetical protein
MKKFLLGIAAAALLGGAVFAQTAPIGGLIYTSPVVVDGSFNYNGGPQSSAVQANGGTLTCTSGGSITVANTSVTANSVFLFGLKTLGGTPSAVFASAVTPGTSFVAKCGSGDTSVYNYIILG